jgi:CHAT domain-containing protein
VTPCPPPDGSHLPDKQREFLAELLRYLDKNGFSLKRIEPSLPKILASFSEVSSEEDDLRAWCQELRHWVRWRRVPAYCLAYILQLVTQSRASVHHFVACDIFSDAQVNFAEDLALSTLETAYANYMRARSALGPAYADVGTALEQKLRVHYSYYASFSRPFAFLEANPNADHLYNELSRYWLVSAAREDDPQFDTNDANALRRLIGECAGNGHAFYRVLARRFLGLLHAGDGRFDLAAGEYTAALDDATRLKLYTEIGHLRRLLGSSLRETGDGAGARQQFEQAYAYERSEPARSLTWYWQALSARELGDTIARFAGCRADATPAFAPALAVIIDDAERTLRPALDAYRDGRKFFAGHLTMQCPFPLARAAKQQIFRSFSDNALQVACMLQSQCDMLAEVELNGPREATAIVTEIAAARAAAPASLVDFRHSRALYYRTLNTLPARFEDYLGDIAAHNDVRRGYLERSMEFDGDILVSQWPDKVAKRILDLRLPDTVFLLFHVGQGQTMMVLVDASAGVAAPYPVPIPAARLREIHEEYAAAIAKSGGRQAALDALLECYAKILNPVLEQVLHFLPGKHLKIFPRLQMNALPLHALRIGGKYLIEHCATVSYGQTLALFLQNHDSASTAGATEASSATVRMVIGDNVPWYELLAPGISNLYGDAFVVERRPSWGGLVRAIAARPTDDTVFACHGTYQPGNLEESQLELFRHGADGAVRFSRVFAELDLQGRRSVVMGACESGLVRAEIAAEYVGLASAMLGSGVRYVVGALWTIPSVATAALVQKYLGLMNNPSASAAAALCEAQRYVMSMTREAVAGWVRDIVPRGPDLDALLKDLAARDEHPFAHPYHWAGLQAVGDI